jgi:hypothetical protein
MTNTGTASSNVMVSVHRALQMSLCMHFARCKGATTSAAPSLQLKLSLMRIQTKCVTDSVFASPTCRVPLLQVLCASVTTKSDGI